MALFGGKKGPMGESSETQKAPLTTNETQGGNEMLGVKRDVYPSSHDTSPDKMNALLGEGSEFEGKLNFEGVVRVDGTIKGEIISKDKLIVGEKALVEAEISVGTAIVSGTVKGNITAS